MTHSDSSIRTYLLVYVALLALVAATVAAAFLPAGPWNLVLALGIALTKALLIILFFMHVKAGSRLIKLFAGAGFLWLVILFVLALSDYLARTYWG
ncbi:MAG: cytochrome C oxidase subunit IV family protein [Anaerolineaceae bacterium]|nr:cytochrome C oxidase subunit IV family protein [Anaerolineaceae bacterium]